MNEYLFIDFGKDANGKDIKVKVLDLAQTLYQITGITKNYIIPDNIKNNENFQKAIAEYRKKDNFAALANKTAGHLVDLHNKKARNGCQKISK